MHLCFFERVSRLHEDDPISDDGLIDLPSHMGPTTRFVLYFNAEHALDGSWAPISGADVDEFIKKFKATKFNLGFFMEAFFYGTERHEAKKGIYTLCLDDPSTRLLQAMPGEEQHKLVGNVVVELNRALKEKFPNPRNIRSDVRATPPPTPV